MMKNLLLLLSLFFTSFSYPAKAGELFKFEVGKYWIYSVQGKVTRDVINRIEQSKVINGKKWYLLNEYDERFWVSNSPEGQVEAVNLFDSQGEYTDDLGVSLVFKFPAKVGEQWEFAGNRMKYLGVKTITVPVGEYQCHMYHMEFGRKNYSDTCIVEGIGVVYQENVLGKDGKEISRLIEYGKL